MSPAALQNAIRRAIGAELRSMRERAGLTQGEVARRMCSHRPIICRIESGKHALRFDTAIAYVSAVDGRVVAIGEAVDRVIASAQSAAMPSQEDAA